MGEAICRHLAAKGHAVAVLDRDEKGARRVVAELRATGANALACLVDVSDAAAVHDAYSKVRAALGPIEILVTAAGIAVFERLCDITPESWYRMINIHLTGTFFCVQGAVDDMIASGWGRIVTISSSGAQSGATGGAHYSAAKGGVIALTRSLSRELAPHGITVNNIPPGSIDTPMLRRAQLAGVVPANDVVARMVPLGRLGTPDDVAIACAFLCTEEAGYITGQVLGVNGGTVLG
jgi:2-hydroxycyclohexanecarboxyl-CoA dehydrogenase